MVKIKINKDPYAYDNRMVVSNSYVNESLTLKEDDKLRIIGEKNAVFKFRAHVLNKETGAEWIDVIAAGTGTTEYWRSFRPDKAIPFVVPKKRVKRGK